MSTLLTGASGLLGVHLTRALAASGARVRAFHLPQHPMPALDVPFQDWPGDVTCEEDVARSIRGCEAVYHAAGPVSYWRGDRALLERVHVEGTRKVLHAALAAGVSRFVYTSSVAAIGFDPEGLADESTAYNFAPLDIGYIEAKRKAERVVRAAVDSGLPAVIVNPGGLIGPMAVQRSTLSLMRSLRRGLLPGTPSGGVNVVAAEDVAAGHLLAARNGKIGERYILGGENLSHRELVARTAAVLGAAAPERTLPSWVLTALGAGCDAFARLSQRAPGLMSRERAALASLRLFYSSARAERQLGYAPGDVGEALERTFCWYVRVRHLPA